MKGIIIKTSAGVDDCPCFFYTLLLRSLLIVKLHFFLVIENMHASFKFLERNTNILRFHIVSQGSNNTTRSCSDRQAIADKYS